MARKYTVTTQVFYGPGDINTQGANAVVFVNRGEQTALVNDEPITTDQSIVNSGLENETDVTRYKVSFTGTDPDTKILVVRIKKYVS